jgi:hypothetical protein
LKFNDSVKMTGNLHIKKMDSLNNLVEEAKFPNLVVATGKSYIASRIVEDSDTGVDVVSRMIIGTNSTPSLQETTQLISPIAHNSFESITTNIPPGTVSFSALFDGDTRDGFIAEAGIISATSSDVVLNSANISLISGNTVAAGSFVIGASYIISTVGTTDFTLIGASANTVGVEFIASGIGSGTGAANERYVEITSVGHPYSNGDAVMYTESDTAIGVLQDGQTYYVSVDPLDEDVIYLSKSYILATQPNPVYIGTSVGVGTNHILTSFEQDTLLCRSTFPAITKNPGESISISWTINVG